MKTIKLYKKYKRLDDGGIPPNEKFAQSVGYGNSALQVANTGNQMFGEQGNEFGVKSNSGAILGGGLQGAAMGAGVGSMFGPIGTIAGGAIGGTIGIIKSNQSNNEAKRREEDYKNQQKQLFLQNQQNSFNQVLNNGFQVQGNMNAQKYAKNGGLLYKKLGDGGKFKPNTESKSDSTKVSKKLFSDKSLILHDSAKTDKDFENYHKNIVTHLKNKYNVSLNPDTNNTRPYYNPINRSISYNPKEDGEASILTKEVPHVIQVDRDGFLLSGYKAIKDIAEHSDWGDLLQIGGKENTKRYDVKGTFENEAHSEIEPKLKKEFSELNNKVYFGESDKNRKDIESLQMKKQGGSLSTMYKNGGNVQKLSKTNVQFNGSSHENGGIKEPLVNGVRLDEVEVEGNESMSTSNGQKFVFSENLGFAQQHKPLAKAMGKIEKYLKSNPNDPIRKRTLNTLKEREEQLKVKQEETKEALGLENNLGEMKLGGAIKRKDGTYIDREGVMKYPLKNGGLTKYAPGGNIPDDPMLDPNYFGNYSPETRNVQDYTSYGGGPGSYTNTLDNLNRNKSLQMQLNMQGAKNVSGKNKGKSLTVDGYIGDNSKWAMVNTNLPKNSGTMVSGAQSMGPYNYKSLPNASVLGGSNLNPSASVKNSSVGGPSSLEGLPGKGATATTTLGNKMNWGNLAGKIIPYVGVASNYMLNEKARKMTTPKEALPDYVKYKPVDYSASKIEADQQRRQLNKSLTQNVTNSAVAAALKAKNLGTTIGAKNLINQEETNVNTEGINRINLVNNQIQQRRNQLDVENRDRDYNKEQRYLTQKGEIVNNFSDIYQKQGRDQRLEGLENRKIDVLSKYDMGRGVHEREIIVPSIVDKQSRGQSLSKQEQDFMDKNPDLFKRNGGVIKKTNKLYNKLKK